MSGSASRPGRYPGFRVDRRMVLANFAYAKLAMVSDLDGALDELVAHELIAALAGDEQARAAIRGQGPGPEAIPGPDQVPLADEFLVLDADSSQNYAINAVLARAEPDRQGAAGNRQEPDDRQPDRLADRPRQEGAVRGGEARRDRCRDQAAAPAEPRRAGAGPA